MPLRPRSKVGAWLSLLAHLLVILLIAVVTRDRLLWRAPPLDQYGNEAGGGGGGSRQVTMIPLGPVPPPATVVPPPPPVVVPPVNPPVTVPRDIPPVDTTPPAPRDTAPAPAAGGTPGSGGGTGGGSGTGTGPGSGPGTGPGSGGTGTGTDSVKSGRPPEPRQLILPPFDYPRSMKGRTIQVTFFVLADGRVDNVVFAEELPDRGYAKKLEQVLRAYRFRPARSAEGLPVPGHTTVSISF